MATANANRIHFQKFPLAVAQKSTFKALYNYNNHFANVNFSGRLRLLSVCRTMDMCVWFLTITLMVCVQCTFVW